MRFLVQSFFFLMLMLAAWSQPVRDGHVEVELVSAQSVAAPGQRLWLGVHFKMDPDWHLYWRNPGETGLAPTLEWILPEGWKVGEIGWPLPRRVVLDDMVQFLYDDQLLLVVPVDVPSEAPLTETRLGVKVDWLACEQSCVPGKAELSLTLPVSTQAMDGPASPLFGRTQAELPASAGPLGPRLEKLSANRALLRLGNPPPGDLDFFPYSQEDELVVRPEWKPELGLEIPLRPGQKKLAGLLVSQQSGQRTGYNLEMALEGGSGSSNPVLRAPDISLLGALWAAFVGGMILNLMPCVFPVLSLKALSLVQQNEEGSKPAWGQGLVYSSGVLVSIWALASPILLLKSGGQQLGWGYQMQSPVFVTLLAILFLAIALNLFGLFEVGESLTRLAAVAEGKKGLSEAFWSGAVATIAATPCTAPFMASALGYAVAQPLALSFLIFTVLGLGMAFPYFVLCVVPATRNWLPRPGAWMETFKQALGFPMLGATIWFTYILANLLSAEGLGLILSSLLTFSIGLWILGRWGWNIQARVRTRAKWAAALVAGLSLLAAVEVARSPAFVPASTPGSVKQGGIEWVAYSPEALAEFRAQGKTVFLDFTAAWCINCKVNEAGTLSQSSVIEAFRKAEVVTMKADWTRKDETIRRALAELGRSGVPVYALYRGQAEPVLLPELLTPEIVLRAIQNP